MSTVAEVRDRVQRFMIDWLGGVSLGEDEAMYFDDPELDVRIWIEVGELSEDLSYVELCVVPVFDIPQSQELFRWVAFSNRYRFGTLFAVECDDGTTNLGFTHSLVGDTLDPEELQTALGNLAVNGRELADEISGQFGGQAQHLRCLT